MCGRYADQQRQKHAEIVGQLKSKHDARQRRTHRAAEYRSHAEEFPESGTLSGQKARFDAAQSAAHHQERSEDAA